MLLYGGLASPYVARVVLFARLKGIDLKPVMPEAGIKSPQFLALNPIGRMPVLDVDGAVIPESEVICEYLEDLHPGTRGLEGVPLERARARTVSRIFDLYVSPHASVLFRNMNPATRDASAVTAATQALETGFGYLEHFISGPCAAGSSLSLADCTLLPSFAIFRKTIFPTYGVTDPTRGNGKLAGWWSTVSADPMGGPFLAEYEAAVDAFLKMLRGGK
jgi:glutathione S-transferase